MYFLPQNQNKLTVADISLLFQQPNFTIRHDIRFLGASMTYFFYIVCGMLIGGAYGFGYGLLGGIFGFILGLVSPFVSRREFEELRQQIQNNKVSQDSPHSAAATRVNSSALAPQTADSQVNASNLPSTPFHNREIPFLQEKPVARSLQPAKPSALKQFLIQFFTEGNVVAKVGMILVFIGVAFLLKLASDYGKFPIEMRLLSLGIGAIVLMALGLRFRKTRPLYALILQGGGVGIFYANVFAAYRLYDLLPAGVTFLVLIVAVMFATFLAVIQNAKSLAVMATLGGFLAPILASDHSGNHVALFSYYAILNLGVFCVAWFQSWRILNLIGFVFTFGVGAVWGLEYYRPELFASVEPFLILNFLCYFVISILYAIKKASERQMLVDATLVFGTPILFFSMQYPLVSDLPYGVFWSALAMGLLYLMTTQYLWKKYSESLRFFSETFLALGTVFTTLALAFLFESPTLAVLYAIEGAGLVFVGVKQKRRLSYYSGTFLIAFVSVGYYLSGFDLMGTGAKAGFVSHDFLQLLAIAGAALFSARTLFHNKITLPEWDRFLPYLHLIYGVIFWLVLGLIESCYQITDSHELAGFVFYLAVSASLFEYLRLKWPWPEAKVLLVVYPIVLSIVYLSEEVNDLHWSTAVWILAIGVLYWHLKRSADQVLHWSAKWQHVIAGWLVVLVLAEFSTTAVTNLLDATGFWRKFFYLFWPLAALGTLILKPTRWPIKSYGHFYARWVLGTWVAWVWLLVFSFQQQYTGAAEPLPYLPFLNPLDLSVALFCVVLAKYAQFCKTLPQPVATEKATWFFSRFYFFTVFIWFSFIVIRSVHHYAAVPFDFDTLFASRVVQTALTIFWSFYALIIMVMASKQKRRYTWLAGASLLALVVAKLFFVDLSQVGNIARVISFLGSGALFVLIGYLSPIPPTQDNSEAFSL